MKEETVELIIMYEEDSTEGNVVAYVPALKLGAIGDNIEEARENVIDIIQEATHGKSIKLLNDPIFEKFSVPVMNY